MRSDDVSRGTRIAATEIVWAQSHLAVRIAWGCLAVALTVPAAGGQIGAVIAYRVEKNRGGITELRERSNARELEILEKLNRVDRENLARLRVAVVPGSWAPDELAYSTMPERYPSGEPHPKLLVVHQPGQMFGAYESGRLVRWGPVSSGVREAPTPAGLFHLNWRAVGHTSTVNPEWFMKWYFNFGNREGLAFHQYVLPGQPASHGCVRLLERDAVWLFEWGDPWKVDDSETRVVEAGTPVLIIGAYDFDAPPPWRSLEWLSQIVGLPPLLDGRPHWSDGVK